MEKVYRKAYSEVIEILKYVPKESVDKIPKIMLESFNNNMDKEYTFSIDLNKSFEEQELLEETKAILANIFRDYWATTYQRERIKAKEDYDLEKIEDEKRNKYNPNDLFKNKRTINVNNPNNLPVEIKKDTFFKKLLDFIKKIINKK